MVLNNYSSNRREHLYITKEYSFDTTTISKIDLKAYCGLSRGNIRITADDKVFLEINEDEFLKRIFKNYGTPQFIDEIEYIRNNPVSVKLEQNDTLIPISQLGITIQGRDIIVDKAVIDGFYLKKKSAKTADSLKVEK